MKHGGLTVAGFKYKATTLCPFEISLFR